MENFQSYLDEHKTHIPDGIYLELCRRSRNIHRALENTLTGNMTIFCTVVCTYFSFDVDGQCECDEPCVNIIPKQKLEDIWVTVGREDWNNRSHESKMNLLKAALREQAPCDHTLHSSFNGQDFSYPAVTRFITDYRDYWM